jgi:pyrimidine-specific ribonucleoside hydrolase
MLCRNRRAVAAMGSVLLLLLASCGGDDGATGPSTEVATTPVESTSPAAESGLAVVVDTDLASDDIVALAYLLSDPSVDVLAVTVSGTGEVTCPRGAEVARGLLTALGHGDVPVACGQSVPTSGEREFPAEWREAADGAWGLSLPAVAPSSDDRDAVELLTATVGGASTPVTLLTLGPLTNVAQALAAEPALVDDLAAVVIMGGAVDVPGNVQPEGATAPLAAEWNLFIDPEASAAVMASGAPITLIALDATNEVPVSAEFVDQVVANDVNEATAIVSQLLTTIPPSYLWDPLAAIAVAHPSLVPSAERAIAVVTEGDDAGRTVEEADGTGVLVAEPPDAAAVLDHLLRTIAGVAEDEPLVVPTTVAVAGEATVSFDGVTCTYDGPTSLPVGAIRVTRTPGPSPYLVGVAHLVEGATLDEALEWLAQHPGEQPPMVDRIETIGEGGLPSPATIELLPGMNPVVCAPPDGSIVPGAVVEAG